MKKNKKAVGLLGIDGPYIPGSIHCKVLNTIVPDSMDYEVHLAISKMKEKIKVPINKFVEDRLHYKGNELANALACEQVDAVALAIYNIEYKQQGIIVADQTGIGKGRVAASIIRYAHFQGLKPIFLSEKPNLFSDIYRDLSAIGSSNLVPFIINGKEAKTDVKDANGNVIYSAPPKTEQDRVFNDKRTPNKYDYVMATYSQFNSPEKKPLKPQFLMSVAVDNIIIMDESHNASGSSNTGAFLQKVLESTRGVTFLSATFAKRPDNMPIYAMKTAMGDVNMNKEELVDAIESGGVALQEILSSQLVQEGQMIRREYTFDGIEVNYISLLDNEKRDREIADKITDIIRDIIGFQLDDIKPIIEELDKIAVAEGKEVEVRKGTSQAGVNSSPYFSKVFNIINQMLFSIKAKDVANMAIKRLKEGKKPIIAFSSTMGSFLEQMTNSDGTNVQEEDVVNADFGIVLQKGLDGVMRYTVKDIDGNSEKELIEVSALPEESQLKYNKILEKVMKISSGITISPIDVLIQTIEKAGYSVGEVTGRKLKLQLNIDKGTGLVLRRKKINVNDAFRQYNDNEIDCLLINQSGSTGASAHAIVTDKVPASQVKQRVMLVLQAELDINKEVQKRGRINRTGQIMLPIYDYVISAIPAELRLMMMLQKKLKSLDANTTSSQKQSKKVLDVADFLNKFGDKIVMDYLKEYPEINLMLDDPLGIESENETLEDAAQKVSGRVAVLSTEMQENFYTEITNRYNDYIEYVKQTGEYDLEVEVMNLDADTIDKSILKVGKGGPSVFGGDSFLEKVEANVLKKPFSKAELNKLIKESLHNKTAEQIKDELIADYEVFTEKALKKEFKDIDDKYKDLIKKVPNEKKIKAIPMQNRQFAIQERIRQLEAAKEMQIDMTTKQFANRKQYIMSIFKFFVIGKGLNYPVESYDQGEVITKCVCLGITIDKKRPNPYAPSAIKIKLALSDSNKYIAIPGSYSKDINAIKGSSVAMYDWQQEEIIDKWDDITKEGNVKRRPRYIITGNLLQAFSSYKGKLVSYTLKGGGDAKGILMPENWDPDKNTKGNVIVPILKALPVIKSLTSNSQITTNDSFTITKDWQYNFKIIVPKSKASGGKFYTDEDILRLVNNNNFYSQGNSMVASLDAAYITELVELLQNKFSCNLTLSSAQFDIIKASLPKEIKQIKDRYSKIIYLEAKHFKLTHNNFYKAVAGIKEDKKNHHPKIKYIKAI